MDVGILQRGVTQYTTALNPPPPTRLLQSTMNAPAPKYRPAVSVVGQIINREKKCQTVENRKLDKQRVYKYQKHFILWNIFDPPGVALENVFYICKTILLL